MFKFHPTTLPPISDVSQQRHARLGFPKVLKLKPTRRGGGGGGGRRQGAAGLCVSLSLVFSLLDDMPLSAASTAKQETLIGRSWAARAETRRMVFGKKKVFVPHAATRTRGTKFGLKIMFEFHPTTLPPISAGTDPPACGGRRRAAGGATSVFLSLPL